jgi:hypothetical protein
MKTTSERTRLIRQRGLAQRFEPAVKPRQIDPIVERVCESINERTMATICMIDMLATRLPPGLDEHTRWLELTVLAGVLDEISEVENLWDVLVPGLSRDPERRRRPRPDAKALHVWLAEWLPKLLPLKHDSHWRLTVDTTAPSTAIVA